MNHMLLLDVIKDSASSVWKHKLETIKVALVPILAAVVIKLSILFISAEFRDMSMPMTWVVLIFAMTAGSWLIEWLAYYRLFNFWIADEKARSWFNLRPDRGYFKFLPYVLLAVLLVGVVVVILSLLSLPFSTFFLATSFAEELGEFMAEDQRAMVSFVVFIRTMIYLVAILIVSYSLARASLMLPATADKSCDSPFYKALRSPQRHTLVFTLFVFPVLTLMIFGDTESFMLYLVLYLAHNFLFLQGWMGEILAMSLFVIVNTFLILLMAILSSSILSSIYKRLPK